MAVIEHTAKWVHRRRWDRFVSEGKLCETLRPEIARSWLRCQGYGLDPLCSCCGSPLSPSEFEDLCKENESLLSVTRIFLPSILSLQGPVEIAVGLQHRDGAILYLRSTETMKRDLEKIRVIEGSSCREENIGTCASSICLFERREAWVSGEEHFSKILHGMLSLAQPLFCGRKEPVGCLFLMASCLGENDKFTPFLRKIFEYAGQLIESEVKGFNVQESIKQREMALSILREGVLLLDPAGFITHANQAFIDMVERSQERLRGTHYSKFLPFLTKSDLQKEVGTSEVLITANGPEEQEVRIVPMPKDLEGRGGAVLTFEGRRPGRIVFKTDQEGQYPYFEGLVGTSHAFRRVIHIANITSESRSNILLQGETGTGKEVLARFIHKRSKRARNPFIAINCAAIPRELAESELFGYEPGAFTGANPKGQLGKFELADKGTLFLDEINALEEPNQRKLLRVLESQEIIRLGGRSVRQVDVRIIAASTSILREEVLQARFLPELLYRINAITINIPPLKERREDISLLADHFLHQLRTEFEKEVKYIDKEAMEILELYEWPGNIRELRNVVQYCLAVTEGRIIRPYDLPEEVTLGQMGAKSQKGLRRERQLREKEILLDAIGRARGNMTKAAQSLGVSRSTLYRKIREYNL